MVALVKQTGPAFAGQAGQACWLGIWACVSRESRKARRERNGSATHADDLHADAEVHELGENDGRLKPDDRVRLALRVRSKKFSVEEVVNCQRLGWKESRTEAGARTPVSAFSSIR